MIDDSFDLFIKLKNLGYIKELRDPYWWPNSGKVETMLGAILTQNTKWQKVEKALENLNSINLIDIDSIIEVDKDILIQAIKPSGFYNTKYKYIKLLCQNIKDEFGTFEDFRENASREWLLSQKGVGAETADSILCYTCYQEEMVVDSYTQRLVKELGFDFDEYEELKSWCKCGINDNFDKIKEIYNKDIEVHEVYALFHGMIVDFCKDNAKGKSIDITNLR